MIIVRLRQAMKVYDKKYHTKSTYDTLAEMTGLSSSTFEAIESRDQYNTTIDTLDRICRALETTPPELLVYDATKPQPTTAARQHRKKVAGERTDAMPKPEVDPAPPGID